jgi:hypothetical protein
MTALRFTISMTFRFFLSNEQGDRELCLSNENQRVFLIVSKLRRDFPALDRDEIMIADVDCTLQCPNQTHHSARLTKHQRTQIA